MLIERSPTFGAILVFFEDLSAAESALHFREVFVVVTASVPALADFVAFLTVAAYSLFVWAFVLMR